jgi:antagonist of KipI
MPLWTSVFVRKGALVEFDARQGGCRAYLAVAGGIAAPHVMNSASAYLPGGFGGYAGRALRAGDALPIGPARGHFPTLAGRSILPEHRPNYGPHPTLRVVLGPQDDYFTPGAIKDLLSQEYTVSTTSDRMGLRLQGPPLTHLGAKEIISSGVALGAIQVPPNAQPIVLTADRQTVGGYPVIATVIRADIPLLAQCLPGESHVRFRVVTVEEAQSIYRAQCRQYQPEPAEPDAINF